jgi:hypothetical protein
MMMLDHRRGYWPLALFVIGVSLLASRPAQAGDRYYLIIFASQSHPKIPRLSHTFATLVKTTDCPADGAPRPLQAYTISWLPKTLKIRPFACHNEPGVNLTLEESLRWAYANRMHVSEWGPYKIDEEFFHIVFDEYARIESGIYRYKGIDPFTRGSLTTDCIHAVSDIDYRHSRAKYFYIRLGDAASRHIVRVLRDRERLLGPHDHGWLNSALGLDHYPIIRRPDP